MMLRWLGHGQAGGGGDLAAQRSSWARSTLGLHPSLHVLSCLSALVSFGKGGPAIFKAQTAPFSLGPFMSRLLNAAEM